MTTKMKLRMKVRYDINRFRPSNGDKYTICRMCLSIMMVICIK